MKLTNGKNNWIGKILNLLAIAGIIFAFIAFYVNVNRANAQQFTAILKNQNLPSKFQNTQSISLNNQLISLIDYGRYITKKNMLLLTKINKCNISQKTFLINNIANVGSITKISEKHFYLELHSFNKKLYIFKLNSDLELLWGKSIEFNQDILDNYFISGNNGSCIFATSVDNGISADENIFHLTKLGSNGSLAWNKKYKVPDRSSGGPLRTNSGQIIMLSPNHLFFFNKKGNLNQIKKYYPTDSTLPFYMRHFTLNKKGDIYMAGRDLLMKVDSSSGYTVSWARRGFRGFSIADGVIEVSKNNTIFYLNSTEVDTSIVPEYTLNLHRLDSNGQLLKKRVFKNHSINHYGYASRGSKNILNYTNDSQVLISAIKRSTNIHPVTKTPVITQLSKSDPLGCYQSFDSVSLESFNVKSRNVSFAKQVTDSIKVKNIKANFQTIPLKTEVLCSDRLYPKAHLGSDTILCHADSFTLAPGPDTNVFHYQWNTGATTPSITIDSTGWYKVLVSYKGCTDRDSIHVTFLDNNPATLGKDTSICEYDSLFLETSKTNGPYRWQPPSVDSLKNARKITRLSKWINRSGTYRLYLDSIDQCPLDTLQLEVYKPPTTGLKDSPSICPGDSFHLIPYHISSYTHSWRLPNNNAVKKPNIWARDTGEYRFYNNDYQCYIDTVHLGYHELPNSHAGPDTLLCHNQEYTMQGSGGITYHWIPAKYLSSDTIPHPKARLPHRQAYHLVVSNRKGCVDTSRVILDVRPPLEVELTTPDETVCRGQEIKVKAEVEGGKPKDYKFSWNSNGKEGKTLREVVEHDRLFKVQVRDNCSEPASDSIFIETKPSAKANFSIKPKDTVFLRDTLKLINRSRNASRYHWSFGEPFATSNKSSPLHIYSDSGAHTVQLVSTHSNGCSDTASKELFVKYNYRLFIPNAFSPDGNGINDQWRIKGSGIKNYQFTIYNRWGEKLFSSKGREEPAWNGTVRSTGAKVPVGVYIYKLKVTDKAGFGHFYNGHVKVVR